MKRNKIISKRILPILLTFAMLLTAVPAMSLSGIFAATYTDPQVGDVAQVRTSSYALKNGKVSESGLSSAPSNAYMAVDKDGVRHTIRNVHFRDTGIAASYNPNLQMFCIEFGAPYPGTSAGFDYEGYSLSTSEYWKSLTKAQKEGVLLIIGFGYPASSYSDLGVSGPGHALAATQILIWEFATGRRTTYTGSAKETDLYDSAIEGEGAETAYWNILKKANEARTSGAYSYEKMLEEAAYVVWEKENYQTMMTWSLIGAPVEPWEERGTIEVYKKNSNGKNLSGAVFTVIDSNGSIVGNIGPTNSSGYAKLDEVPFGHERQRDPIRSKQRHPDQGRHRRMESCHLHRSGLSH